MSMKTYKSYIIIITALCFYFGTQVAAFIESSPDIEIDLLAADVRSLGELLISKQVTSQTLVNMYLDQIDKHDNYLHAMIQTTPREILMKRAQELDKEREAGKVRGPLHGIPIILKDSVATHLSLGLGTTAGSLALLDSKSRRNDVLLARGAIILGKSDLSEFSDGRGWSAVGGQTQSAYVRGGILSDDGSAGHSNPGGASTGSAVAVSAGYTLIAVGEETDGSLICPAGRAALYTIKPTIGFVPSDGIVPISRNFDSTGPDDKVGVNYSCEGAVEIEKSTNQHIRIGDTSDSNEEDALVHADSNGGDGKDETVVPGNANHREGHDGYR
ncbi:amidase signature domain-containing protein [Aspergillus cavernicola]|uniref:Amidase signature domain-containing protein n=1 Tax=Aspergillus cavernicola TaxID=176166 RepID=A0ABR4HZE1_9EURO